MLAKVSFFHINSNRLSLGQQSTIGRNSLFDACHNKGGLHVMESY